MPGTTAGNVLLQFLHKIKFPFWCVLYGTQRHFFVPIISPDQSKPSLSQFDIENWLMTGHAVHSSEQQMVLYAPGSRKI